MVPLVQPGLCGVCRHVSRNDTRRGTVYFRCTRAQWDERLVRYPRLPVVACVGFEVSEVGVGGFGGGEPEAGGSEVGEPETEAPSDSDA